MTRAVIYCRISKDTAGQALGVERQETECRALCERRQLDVVDVLVDNDISAFSGKERPSFERLGRMMDEGAVDIVVAWHPDRLTRQPTELETLIDRLERCSTTVATVQAGDYDLSTPAGRMSARIVGAVARGESEHKSARLKSKSDQLAESGDAPGGRTPYGYTRARVDGRSTYVVDKAEADALHWMADRVREGRSMLWIARQLDERGTKTREGKDWQHSTVRAVLANPAAAGLRVHRREIAGVGSWTPIFDRDEWEALRTVVADPARKHKRPAAKYILSGIIRTSAGDPMVGRPGHADRRTYVTPGVGQSNPWVSIDAERTEVLVIEAVLQHYDDIALAAPDPDTVTLGVVSSVEAELEELARMSGASEITFAEWKAMRAPMLDRLADAKSRVPTRRSAELSEPGTLRDRWPNLDHARRRDLLREALEYVAVAPSGRGRWANPADRITVRMK